jgi:hypothetical protein
LPCGGDTGQSDGLYTRDAALVWSGMTRSARPAMMDKPLRCRPLEGRRDQRSPLRRCFKPRPPLSAGCAGFASGCRLSGSELKRPMISPLGLESLGFDPRPHSGRLSGLLSGCPPTGTRPQARAKLGNRELISMHHRCKSFFALAQNFLVAGSRNGYAAVAIARREPRVRCLDAPRYRTLLPLVEVRGCAQRARIRCEELRSGGATPCRGS